MAEYKDYVKTYEISETECLRWYKFQDYNKRRISTRMQKETAESLKTLMVSSSSVQLHKGTRSIENDKVN